MFRKIFFICLFISVPIILISTQGQCQNWEDFYEKDNKIWQYDKDSIHYPNKKKTVMGFVITNKDFVNVWVRLKDKETGQIAYNGGVYLLRFFCSSRKWYFDLEAARSAGVRNSAIAEFLSERNSFDIVGARKAGHSDRAIILYLLEELQGEKSEDYREWPSIPPGQVLETLYKKVCK